MTTRMSSRQVTFNRSFILAGFCTIQAAGTYTVDTEEELIDSLSFPVWKRTSAHIHLTKGSTIEYIPIDIEELNEALKRDGEQPASMTQNPVKS